MIEIDDEFFLVLRTKVFILVLDLDLPQKTNQNLLPDEIQLSAKAPLKRRDQGRTCGTVFCSTIIM